MIKLNELVYLSARWIRFIANFMYVSICTCTNKKKLHKKSRTKPFVRSVCKVIAKICQHRLIYFMTSDSLYVRYFLFILWEKLISKNIMHSHNQPIYWEEERKNEGFVRQRDPCTDSETKLMTLSNKYYYNKKRQITLSFFLKKKQMPHV